MITRKEFIQIIRKTLFWPMVFLLLGSSLLILDGINRSFQPAVFANYNQWFPAIILLGQALITIAIVIFAYQLSILFLHEFERRLAEKGSSVSVMILATVRAALRVVFFLIALHVIVTYIGLPAEYTDIVNKVIYGVLIGFVGWVILQIINTVEAYYHNAMNALPGTIKASDMRERKAAYTRIHLIKNSVATIIIICTMAAILMLFDKVRDFGISLLASAGVLTAIVGVSAQKTLTSLFSGLQLAFSQPIKIDDIVIIQNEYGTVEEITLTYVVLKLWDLRRMVVPINYFLENPFQNWSRTNANLVGAVFIYTDYTLPAQALRDELCRQLESCDLWDKKVGSLQVNDFKEHCVEYRALVSACNPGDLDTLKAIIREKLLNFIRENYPDCFPKQRIQPGKDLKINDGSR